MSNFHLFNNGITSRCQGSKIKLGRVGEYLFIALTENSGDPFINDVLIEFTPFRNNYKSDYLDRQTAPGAQHGSVVLKNKIMGEIHSHDLAVWDNGIQGFYLKGTDEYAAIFVNGHRLLHKGSVDDQLIELAAIIDRMEAYPLLATIMAAMAAKYGIAHGATFALGQNKTGTKTSSSNLVNEYDTYGDKIFKIYGELVHEYGANESILALYIDHAELMRKPEDNIITKNALAHSIDDIAVRTRLADEVIEIINLGTVDLNFFVIRKPGEAKGIFVTVPAGQTMSFARSLFGDMSYRYFMVENLNLTTAGRFEITFPN
jgi:hypothetical protein